MAGTDGSCQNLTHAPQQIRCLFNHLVGTRKQGRWNFKAERLGGLEVGTNSYLVGACNGRSPGFEGDQLGGRPGRLVTIVRGG